MLLEQFGGANGELAAAMQYSIQGLNCEDPARKDLLMDIGTEELSHLEVVGTLARLHLAPMKFKREAAEADPLIAIAGGGGVNLFNSMGNAWTADYLKINDGAIQSEASEASDPGTIRDLLIDQMRDLLHAEKQLIKALPKMAKAAQSEQLTTLIDQHFAETEMQVERLAEGLKMLDAPARAKPCKGMMGLLEEGDEVLSAGKKMQPAGADLALIGAAQKVEHYEMAGYTTARNLAQQLRMPDLVQLLQLSLAEEANADQLLNQLARPLMSAARMPAPVA